jgi:lycopene cyclase domain-containing protein
VPGIYLGAILFSLAGVIAIDLKVGLALRMAPGRTALAVGLGTVFFLAWDAIGILSGVFVKGDSPLFVGIDVAPHLPLEEVFFLLFLSYLAMVVWTACERVVRTKRDAETRSRAHAEEPAP